MSDLIDWGNAGIRLRIALHDDRAVVVFLGPTGVDGEDLPARIALPPAEVLIAGDRLPQGRRHVGLGTSARLRYVAHFEESDGDSSTLTLTQRTADGIELASRFTVFGDLSVIRVTQTVANRGAQPVVLERLTTLSLNGFARFRSPTWRDALRLRIPHNTLFAEFSWNEHTLPDLGIVDVGLTEGSANSSKARIAITSVGTQSTNEYLPMGALEDRDRGVAWAWQIEANGGWHWEVGDHLAAIYLSTGGPNDQEHHWHRRLEPGASFTSVPVALASTAGRLEDALRPLTAYRRLIRRPHADNVSLPVVFNDFMNCVDGDPTEEKVLALVAAAAAAGCEYFCVDAGWYADEEGWWTTVGEWTESTRRFPRGLGVVFDEVRRAGMIPGLWIEPEVVGVESPVADLLPEDAFFRRHGARIDSDGRHHLDFRSRVVRERLDAIIDRLVGEYGLGYLKLDYNVNGGVGTEVGSTSAGDALLNHHRAFLRWIEALLDRHPGLVLEDCSSGGARVDYASLSLFPILSTSDQTDHVRYPAISAGAPSGVAPEQAAVWVYPQPHFDAEELRLSLVNGLLARPQLSGGLAALEAHQLRTVADAMEVYRGYRERIPGMLPVWPIGLPGWYDDWIAQGLVDDEGLLLAVWRRGGEPTRTFALGAWAGSLARADVLFPRDVPTDLVWDHRTTTLTLGIDAVPGARLIRIRS